MSNEFKITHGAPSAVVDMQQAVNSAREGQDTSMVTVISPKEFKLTLDDHNQVQFKAGAQECPAFLTEHWFVKANGVKLYDGKLPPPVPEGVDVSNIADWRRQDGPTIEEWLEAGYPADKYPPVGYAPKSTPGEVAAAAEEFAAELERRKALRAQETQQNTSQENGGSQAGDNQQSSDQKAGDVAGDKKEESSDNQQQNGGNADQANKGGRGRGNQGRGR